MLFPTLAWLIPRIIPPGCWRVIYSRQGQSCTFCCSSLFCSLGHLITKDLRNKPNIAKLSNCNRRHLLPRLLQLRIVSGVECWLTSILSCSIPHPQQTEPHPLLVSQSRLPRPDNQNNQQNASCLVAQFNTPKREQDIGRASEVSKTVDTTYELSIYCFKVRFEQKNTTVKEPKDKLHNKTLFNVSDENKALH